VVVPAHARSLPIRRAVTPNVIEANLSTVQLRQPMPVSFLWKETGINTAAAALAAQPIAAFVPVTIGVTNLDVTGYSNAEDGAAAHAKGCTRLTVRHAPVITLLSAYNSGSRGAGLVSQRSLHPPTSSEVLRRPDHEMPKLPAVRSRPSRVRGQPSQAAGALIPDNTQPPWREV